MKIKTISIEEYINFRKYLKNTISFADNIIIGMPTYSNNALCIHIFDKNMTNKFNVVISENYKIEIKDNTLDSTTTNNIIEYIKKNLFEEEYVSKEIKIII
jgi:hypothetical protein